MSAECMVGRDIHLCPISLLITSFRETGFLPSRVSANVCSVCLRARAVCVLACVCVRAWLSTLQFGSQIIDAVTALATITSSFVSSADVVFS